MASVTIECMTSAACVLFLLSARRVFTGKAHNIRQRSASRSRRLKCRPADVVRTCCPLGQLALHCTFVLWPAGSLAAKIERCPGRRVDGRSQPGLFLGMRCPGTRGTILILATAIHTRHPTASPPASPSTTPRASAQNSPMKNPVAHEVPELATGARPGESGGQR